MIYLRVVRLKGVVCWRQSLYKQLREKVTFRGNGSKFCTDAKWFFRFRNVYLMRRSKVSSCFLTVKHSLVISLGLKILCIYSHRLFKNFSNEKKM